MLNLIGKVVQSTRGSTRLVAIVQRNNSSAATSQQIKQSESINRRVEYCEKTKLVLINSDVDKTLKFPSIWLRDNCQCSECFHVGSTSRTIDWEKFDVTVSPKEVWVSFYRSN